MFTLDEKRHHAYAIAGGAGTRQELFKMLEKSWGIETKGNPDFSYRKFQTLAIDEARNLKEHQEKKSFAVGGRKIFVIEADAITAEAQNSLLKMFEEPTDHTHFFIIGACVKNLIPTLASRVSKIRINEDEAPAAYDAAGAGKELLALSKPARLPFVKKLADDIKDEKKTKAEALTLVNQIEQILYQKSKKEGALPPKILETVETCRDYMSDRSASVKMLLEYIALVA